MKIIGIDPGLTRTGWGVIEAKGSHLKHLAHGVITTPAKADLPHRLTHIYDTLVHTITTWQPDTAAVEETFVNNNQASALKLGFARGVALLAPAKAGLEVGEYPATLVKKAVTGAGRADKAQIQAVIKMLLPGIDAPPDAADALAVAICHAHHASTKTLLGGVMAGGKR
ncbi:MAG: crossover junction endodeoxyribonuclease RuvC [Alphaproteobacteria bacterium]|nr:crossover junction endodeoxyribonuclease RuvC [Alphaproteobacteria bacterium]